MSVVTIIWSMIASACLTLAIIYLLVWYRNRGAWAYLFFSLTSVATTGLAFCELWRMRAQTPAEMLLVMTVQHVPLFVWLVSVTWFVWFYLGAGRLWLAWIICAIRVVSLIGNLLLGQDVSFRGITSLQHITFLGEVVTVQSGVPNPLTPITQFATWLILIFVADATITAWRRGDRRKAIMVGGSVELFLLLSLGQATLAVWAGLRIPVIYSVPYLGLVAVMGYELSREVLRASALVRELKTSEAGLRESEQRMSLAVDVADLGIWTRDLEYNRVWASERWRALFGFAPADRIDADEVLRRVHADDRAMLDQAQERALTDGGHYQVEYRLALPDGGVRWISSHARVETDPAGRPISMRGASRDVTARKQAEQETVLLREEIAHAGRVSMLGQLSAALAHEINQPLGAIRLNADAASRFLNRAEPDLEEIRAILIDISKESERAGAVIGGMRNLLKRQALDARPLDLRELVAEVSALVRPHAVARHVKMSVEVEHDLPLVRGDRVHLQQVLLNLLLNGMDALGDTPPADRRIRLWSRRDADAMVEVGVADGGHGIADDKLALVFEPFFTTKPSGMGMGLPISRTIIEAHGGRIWAEHAASGGAAFRFTLPISETP